jgi:hypothetical protein
MTKPLEWIKLYTTYSLSDSLKSSAERSVRSAKKRGRANLLGPPESRLAPVPDKPTVPEGI